jgi:hypothetical protein
MTGNPEAIETPDKSGGLNGSTQHHLIKGCSLKVVWNEDGKALWIFCSREGQDLELLESRAVAA